MVSQPHLATYTPASVAQPVMWPSGQTSQVAQLSQAPQAPPVASPQPAQVGLNPQVINDKINELLKKKTVDFQALVKPYFGQVAGSANKLNYQQAVHFMELASQGLVGQRLGAQQLPELEFMRFDFDADRTLNFNEASVCLKSNLKELGREINRQFGFNAEVKVNNKTPEKAGYTVVKTLASGGQGSTKLAKQRWSGSGPQGLRQGKC
jgi:hypothetical protein